METSTFVLVGYVMVKKDRIGRKGDDMFYILENLFWHTNSNYEGSMISGSYLVESGS